MPEAQAHSADEGCWLGQDANRTVQVGRVIHHAVLHHGLHPANIADVGNGITLNQDDIRQFSGGDGTQFLIALHHSGSAQRGQLQHLGRRNAGLNVELQFAVQVTPSATLSDLSGKPLHGE